VNVFFFSIYLIFPAALGPGVYSVSNKNEYQKKKKKKEKKSFRGVKCGRCVGLTALPPYVSQLSRQCGIHNFPQPYRPPRPVTGIASLYFYACIYVGILPAKCRRLHESIIKIIKLSLCLTKHYTMKAYWRVDVEIHVFLISALAGGVFSYTLRPLYPRGKAFLVPFR
jgi:hypothetical protein